MLKRSLFKPPVFLLLAAGLLSISACGAKLGSVYSISYHSGQVEKPYAAVAEMRSLAAADFAPQGGRFIPGEVSAYESISVVFDLITD